MKNKNKGLDLLRERLLYFAMFVVFIIPLIVFFKKVEVPEAAAFIYGPTEFVPDFFAYYKAKVLQFSALILLAGTLWIKWQHPQKTFKPSVFEGLLMAFAGAVFLSFLFSDFKEVAWHGWLDRFEGTATWLSYIALAYSVHNLVLKKEEADKLIGAFVLSSLGVSLIGTFQYFGMDLFQSELGKRMILGSYYEQLGPSLNFTFEEGRVYSTLYNPNYIGSLVAVSLPLALYMALNVKTWPWRIVMGLTPIFQLIALSGSGSAAGFAATAVAIIVFLLMLFFQSNWTKKQLFAGVAVILILVTGAFQTDLFQSQYSRLKSNLQSFREPEYNPFKAVEYNHPILTVIIEDGSKFHIEPVGYDIQVYDEDWVALNREEREDRHRFTSRKEYDFVVDKIHETGRVNVYAFETGEHLWLAIRMDLIYPSHFSLGHILFEEERLKVEVKPLIPSERAFSSRGYIFNRTLPLIQSKTFFGNGADTYMLNFPHLDLIGRRIAMPTTLVDKPHNIHLQLFYNFGFLGGLLFYSLMSYNFWQLKKSLLLSSLVAFLVVGIANDSVVFVSYMVFVLMALSRVMAEKSEVKS